MKKAWGQGVSLDPLVVEREGGSVQDREWKIRVVLRTGPLFDVES